MKDELREAAKDARQGQYRGGLGDKPMQHAWMRYAEENDVPHDHEDEDPFKYGFDAGRHFEARLVEALARYQSSFGSSFEQACRYEQDQPTLCRTHNYERCPVETIQTALAEYRGEKANTEEKHDNG